MPEQPCPHHERLQQDITEIKNVVQGIATRVSRIDVDLGERKVRLTNLERIVFGAVGIALVCIGGAIVRSVMLL